MSADFIGMLGSVCDLVSFVSYVLVSLMISSFLNMKISRTVRGLLISFSLMFLTCGAAHLVLSYTDDKRLVLLSKMLGASMGVLAMLLFAVYHRYVRSILQQAVDLEDEMRTKRAELCRLKRMHEKAVQLSQAKSNFVATITHEIRTPLHGILGLADMLRESDLSVEQRKDVDMIKQSGKLLLALLNDVLDFSKYERTHTELESRPFELSRLVSMVHGMSLGVAMQRNITLRATLDARTPKLVSLDEKRMCQVLNNLIANAVKFTPDGGTVSLNVSVECSDWVRQLSRETFVWGLLPPDALDKDPLLVAEARLPSILEAQEESSAEGDSGPLLADTNSSCVAAVVTPEKFLVCTVADSGIGIPEEKMSAIFECFEQVDTSVSRRFGGTGLGLAIVRAIVEKMGGFVAVKSQMGQGSSFFVCIPYRPVSEECEVDGLRSSNPSSGATEEDEWKELYAGKLFSGQISSPSMSPPMSPRGDSIQADVMQTLAVVVAEDNLINQKVLLRMLKSLGYSDVRVADDGAAAVQLCKDRKTDVVFMDLQMPVMDGSDAAKVIRDTCNHQPFIIACSASPVGLEEKGSAFDSQLPKPCPKSAVKAILDEYIACYHMRG